MKPVSDSPRKTERLNPFSTVVSCIVCIFALACPGFADSVPLATYNLSLQVNDAPPKTITNKVVPNTVASIIRSGTIATGASYTGRATADTGQASTFTPIIVSVQGEVDAQATAPLNEIGLSVSSSISYYFRVEQTAPAPVDVVRLLIHSNLHADATTSGTGDARFVSADFAIPDLFIFHHEMATSEMSFTDSASATVGQDIQVQIGATGNGVATGALDCCAGHATFQAIADPTIQIDPSFAYADDFAVAFSPNLPSFTAVPEPSSIALLAIGLLTLMALVRGNGLHRRFED